MPSDYDEYREEQDFRHSIEEVLRKAKARERAAVKSDSDGLLPDGSVYTPSDTCPF